MDTSIGKVDIVLNPLLNQILITTDLLQSFLTLQDLKAVGIYSNTKPFADFINNNQDGILLENNIDFGMIKFLFF